MCSGLAGADDTADLLAFFRFFWPRMNDQQQHWPDESDSVPAIAVRVRVWSRCMERIVKHKHRGLERQAVLEAVCRRLIRVPRPAHLPPHVVVTNMELQVYGVKIFVCVARAPGASAQYLRADVGSEIEGQRGRGGRELLTGGS